MAFMIKEKLDLKGILFLMLLTIPSEATNFDCHGKPFHCVNATHFMICVDLGSGISTTIDDFMIPCPSITACRRTNRFECEFPAPSASELKVSTVATTLPTESDVTTFLPPATSAAHFKEYFDTISHTTLSETDLLTTTTDFTLPVEPTTAVHDITNTSDYDVVIIDKSTKKEIDAKLDTIIINGPATTISPNNHTTLSLDAVPIQTTTINNELLPSTDISKTRVNDFLLTNSNFSNLSNVTSVDYSTALSNQTVTTEKIFTTILQEPLENLITSNNSPTTFNTINSTLDTKIIGNEIQSEINVTVDEFSNHSISSVYTKNTSNSFKNNTKADFNILHSIEPSITSNKSAVSNKTIFAKPGSPAIATNSESYNSEHITVKYIDTAETINVDESSSTYYQPSLTNSTTSDFLLTTDFTKQGQIIEAVTLQSKYLPNTNTSATITIEPIEEQVNTFTNNNVTIFESTTALNEHIKTTEKIFTIIVQAPTVNLVIPDSPPVTPAIKTTLDTNLIGNEYNSDFNVTVDAFTSYSNSSENSSKNNTEANFYVLNITESGRKSEKSAISNETIYIATTETINVEESNSTYYQPSLTDTASELYQTSDITTRGQIIESVTLQSKVLPNSNTSTTIKIKPIEEQVNTFTKNNVTILHSSSDLSGHTVTTEKILTTIIQEPLVNLVIPDNLPGTPTAMKTTLDTKLIENGLNSEINVIVDDFTNHSISSVNTRNITVNSGNNTEADFNVPHIINPSIKSNKSTVSNETISISETEAPAITLHSESYSSKHITTSKYITTTETINDEKSNSTFYQPSLSNSTTSDYLLSTDFTTEAQIVEAVTLQSKTLPHSNTSATITVEAKDDKVNTKNNVTAFKSSTDIIEQMVTTEKILTTILLEPPVPNFTTESQIIKTTTLQSNTSPNYNTGTTIANKPIDEQVNTFTTNNVMAFNNSKKETDQNYISYGVMTGTNNILKNEAPLFVDTTIVSTIAEELKNLTENTTENNSMSRTTNILTNLDINTTNYYRNNMETLSDIGTTPIVEITTDFSTNKFHENTENVRFAHNVVKSTNMLDFNEKDLSTKSLDKITTTTVAGDRVYNASTTLPDKETLVESKSVTLSTSPTLSNIYVQMTDSSTTTYNNNDNNNVNDKTYHKPLSNIMIKPAIHTSPIIQFDLNRIVITDEENMSTSSKAIIEANEILTQASYTQFYTTETTETFTGHSIYAAISDKNTQLNNNDNSNVDDNTYYNHKLSPNVMNKLAIPTSPIIQFDTNQIVITTEKNTPSLSTAITEANEILTQASYTPIYTTEAIESFTDHSSHAAISDKNTQLDSFSLVTPSDATLYHSAIETEELNILKENIGISSSSKVDYVSGQFTSTPSLTESTSTVDKTFSVDGTSFLDTLQASVTTSVNNKTMEPELVRSTHPTPIIEYPINKLYDRMNENTDEASNKQRHSKVNNMNTDPSQITQYTDFDSNSGASQKSNPEGALYATPVDIDNDGMKTRQVTITSHSYINEEVYISTPYPDVTISASSIEPPAIDLKVSTNENILTKTHFMNDKSSRKIESQLNIFLDNTTVLQDLELNNKTVTPVVPTTKYDFVTKAYLSESYIEGVNNFAQEIAAATVTGHLASKLHTSEYENGGINVSLVINKTDIANNKLQNISGPAYKNSLAGGNQLADKATIQILNTSPVLNSRTTKTSTENIQSVLHTFNVTSLTALREGIYKHEAVNTSRNPLISIGDQRSDIHFNQNSLIGSKQDSDTYTSKSRVNTTTEPTHTKQQNFTKVSENIVDSISVITSAFEKLPTHITDLQDIPVVVNNVNTEITTLIAPTSNEGIHSNILKEIGNNTNSNSSSTTFVNLTVVERSNLPVVRIAKEIPTGSVVVVDKNIDTEKTHSGIISLITKINKSEKNPKEYEDQKIPENFTNKLFHREKPKIEEREPEEIPETPENKTEVPIEVLLTTSTIYNNSTREEMLVKSENNSFQAFGINNAESSTLKLTKNSSSTNNIKSKINKETPTLELVEYNTDLTTDTYTSNSKSKDQNKNTSYAHNATVIFRDQSSTPRYVSQTKSTAVGNAQTEFPAFESTSRKPETNNFTCKQKIRGRYADALDCRKFYICTGNVQVVEGTCPTNTVFSEISKQCTKNLSQCIRNNQFRCVTEGRFSDFLNDNVYYICVKNNLSAFIRFKLQCQNGYHLNKTSVRCVLNKESKESSKSEASTNNSDQSLSLTISPKKNKTSKPFKCNKPGIFPDSTDCKRYFECIKTEKRVFKQKLKKCDSDEVFHKDKKKCVDDESYECN